MQVLATIFQHFGGGWGKVHRELSQVYSPAAVQKFRGKEGQKGEGFCTVCDQLILSALFSL